jgi:Phage integrase, N-terminal SAM-like domain
VCPRYWRGLASLRCGDCGWLDAFDGQRWLGIAFVAETLIGTVNRLAKHVSPRTRERYEQIATKNICSLIGGKALSKLQAIDIREAYAKALESGRCDGKGGLSPRTVHHMHRVLFSALDQAERWKLIARNPAALLESGTGRRSSASRSPR